MRSKSSFLIRRRVGRRLRLCLSEPSLTARIALFALLSVSGCANNLSQNYQQLRPKLAAHQDQEALAYLDGAKTKVYGADNLLLYYMDRAMVEFDARDHLSCVATLETAKTLAQSLWAKSLGKETLAWLTNDNALPYQGEDFEKVFVHLLAALSYAREGKLSDARVEARQVDGVLKRLHDKLTGKLVAYQDDAFAHYLSGLLYEADGTDLSHLSDARIEYSQALRLYDEVDTQAYQTLAPQQLIGAMARVLAALGAEGASELSALQKRHGAQALRAAAAPRGRPDHGRIVVVALMGEAPIKTESSWALVLGPNIYRVAYPVFLRHTKRPAPLIAVSGHDAPFVPELVMDVQNIAIRNLADHMDRIKDRVLAREVAKYAAGTVAESVGLEQGGLVGLGTFLAGLALNTATSAQAQADTRSWVTLPEAIYLYAFDVAPGQTTLQVGAGPPQTVTVKAQQTAFIAARMLF